MKPVAFGYVAATSVEHALSELRQHGDDARPLAGGQSLVPMLALRLARPSVLVDLNRVASLTGISASDTVIRIGAMTRQAAALQSQTIRDHVPLIAEALAHVGHPPTRTRGTIGGSISHADPAAELPAVMVALDAEMLVAGPTGERRVHAHDFFRDAFDTAMSQGEILIEVRVPAATGAAAFSEVSLRHGDFAIACVALCLDLDEGGRCRSSRIAVGGIGPVPVRCSEVEQSLLGREMDDATVAGAIEALSLDRIEAHSRNASVAYRRRVVPVLLRRTLRAAVTKSRGTGP